jgi:2-keto-4-pentenoate hydratase
MRFRASTCSLWNIKLADTVADNASSGMFVLGSSHVAPSAIDWTGCQMLMKRHADEVSRGAGEECLGNPLNAAVWVARKMIEVGRPIQAGDCILTGALGPMVPVSSGDYFTAWIDGFDPVSVSLI